MKNRQKKSQGQQGHRFVAFQMENGQKAYVDKQDLLESAWGPHHGETNGIQVKSQESQKIGQTFLLRKIGGNGYITPYSLTELAEISVAAGQILVANSQR